MWNYTGVLIFIILIIDVVFVTAIKADEECNGLRTPEPGMTTVNTQTTLVTDSEVQDVIAVTFNT